MIYHFGGIQHQKDQNYQINFLTFLNIKKKGDDEIIKIEKTKKGYVYDQEAVNFVFNEYFNNFKGGRTIGRELGVSEHAIYKILHENNGKIRNDREQALKYICNENFFDDINTEEKAYWLGFLYADGFIINKTKYQNYKIGITLSEKDKEHLEKFKKAINFNGEIKTYIPSSSSYKGTKPYSKILISSNHLAEMLIEKGCVLNKTKKLFYPDEKIIPSHLEKHFIRGLIDGDGSLIITHLNDGEKKEFALKFTGTKNMCENILKFFGKEKNLISQRHKNEKVDNWSLSLGGNLQVIKFVEILYKTANIYLDRKYQIYLKMLSIVEGSSNIAC